MKYSEVEWSSDYWPYDVVEVLGGGVCLDGLSEFALCLSRLRILQVQFRRCYMWQQLSHFTPGHETLHHNNFSFCNAFKKQLVQSLVDPFFWWAGIQLTNSCTWCRLWPLSHRSLPSHTTAHSLCIAETTNQSTHKHAISLFHSLCTKKAYVDSLQWIIATKGTDKASSASRWPKKFFLFESHMIWSRGKPTFFVVFLFLLK